MSKSFVTAKQALQTCASWLRGSESAPVSNSIEATENTAPLPGDQTSASNDVRRRRGEVEKCPVCGSHVDAEAYHCPTCHSFYCFHCRARLLPSDVQLQCINQECEYYGKLTCGLCDPVLKVDAAPAVYVEPEDGYWPALLAIVIVVSIVTWFYTSFGTAFFTAIAAFAGGGWVMQQLGLNIFGKQTTVEHPRKSKLHTCIRCHSEAKRLANRQ